MAEFGRGIQAVIFDLDGVLIDSEQLWDRARRAVVDKHRGTWRPGATRAMQGMSSREWSAYLHTTLGVPLPPRQITEEVVARLMAEYEARLPLLPGATAVVPAMAGHWPLGLASSSNRPVIDLVLQRSGLGEFFTVTVSSEEVARGKPAPDVYLEVARRLGVAPPRCAAVEDSANGIRSAAAAGMAVIALPDSHFPPPAEVLALARGVLDNLAELTPELLS